jgi:hypothetical protein
VTYFGHAFMGAAAYATLNHQFGLGLDVAAPVVGAIFGSAPDTIDWVGYRFKWWPRWWLYGILHFWKPALIVEALLIAPGLHTIVFDPWIHPPILPRGGDSADYDAEMFQLFGKPIARRDIHYMTGEVALWAIAAILWMVGT